MKKSNVKGLKEHGSTGEDERKLKFKEASSSSSAHERNESDSKIVRRRGLSESEELKKKNAAAIKKKMSTTDSRIQPVEEVRSALPPEIKYLLTNKGEEFYNMRFPSRVLIVTVQKGDKYNEGIGKDTEILTRFLDKIGFVSERDIEIRNFSSWDDAKEFVLEMSMTDFSGCSSLICCVLCRNNRQIYFDLDKLWEPFSNTPSLVGKPKLFFIQACRELKFTETLIGSQPDYEKRKCILPKFSDLFVVLPVRTDAGGEIMEDEASPSKFVESLGGALRGCQHYGDDVNFDLAHCLDATLRSATNGQQMAQVTSTLLHRIPLYPSLHLIFPPKSDRNSPAKRGKVMRILTKPARMLKIMK